MSTQVQYIHPTLQVLKISHPLVIINGTTSLPTRYPSRTPLPSKLGSSSSPQYAVLYDVDKYSILDIKKGVWTQSVECEEEIYDITVEEEGRIVRLTSKGVLIDEAGKTVKRVKVPKAFTDSSVTLTYLSANTYVLSSATSSLTLSLSTGTRTPLTKKFLFTSNSQTVTSANNTLYISSTPVPSVSLKSSPLNAITHDPRDGSYLLTFPTVVHRISSTFAPLKKYPLKCLVAYGDYCYTPSGTVQSLETSSASKRPIDTVSSLVPKKSKTEQSNFKSVSERLDLLRSTHDSDSDSEGSTVNVGRDDLHSVLVQSLESGDRQMLEGCLDETSPKVIDETLRKFTQEQGENLIERIVSRIVRKPMRVLELGPWVQGVVGVFGGRVRGLEGLRRIIGERVEGVKELRELEGRLSLIGE
ncbi:hypothetical protein TrVE_jg5840 [Triparma verrucosa]|uniref:Uncharacterized protein n=1 Tax=Triparma verrucosa TaxID=1606542 RepID=A0A9W7C201_9STRA|nr:hypothetical protein TrVE_jg5840 [Triparma verrucosa]